MTEYEKLRERIREEPRTWLVTGAAGFIGSNLVEALVGLGQRVVGLDNFATGHRRNVDQVRAVDSAGLFRFVEADICDLAACLDLVQGVDIVLHQAALGSVPRSIEDPVRTNRANVDGFLNVLQAARAHRVRRVVYASSSSVYGDSPVLPKVEDRVGVPLSPYAVSKYTNELYAQVFGRVYGIEVVGLRYFNVFGPRQDPNGAYAAVVPRWIGGLLAGEQCYINGDGKTSRDFCYVANVVQANLLAAVTERSEALGTVYNIAVGDRTNLNELYRLIRDGLASARPEIAKAEPHYREFREGDVRHSLADISRAKSLLGFEPTASVTSGMEATIKWYLENLDASAEHHRGQ